MRRTLSITIVTMLIITVMIMPAYAAPKEKPFKDMKGYEWAEESVNRMYEKGILKGVGNGLFNPQKPVTWEETIIMLIRALGLEDDALSVKEIPAELKNLKIDQSFIGYVVTAYENGLITLDEIKTINFKTPIKKVEIARLVVRALGLEDYVDGEYDLADVFGDINDIDKSDIPYVYISYLEDILKGSNGKFMPEKPVIRAEIGVIIDRLISRLGNIIPLPPKSPDIYSKYNYLNGTVIDIDKHDNTLSLKISNLERPTESAYDGNREVKLTYREDAPFFNGIEYNDIEDIKTGEYVYLTVFDSQIVFAGLNEEREILPGKEIELEAVDLEDVPDDVAGELEDIREGGGYKAVKIGSTYYLLAAAGEKSTGGYSINIYSARNSEEGNIDVFVMERSPKPGDMVTQAITYPCDIKVIKPSGKVNTIRFLDNKGNILKVISF
ncbi:MAG: S-layer homology domain-containing protein [Thermoanaerobacteraceae bacterium]|nr:S-layer homology domain-containing protein [Thermoanaerobacteraceae bacterium]